MPVAAATAPPDVTWNGEPEPTERAAAGDEAPTPRRAFTLSQ